VARFTFHPQAPCTPVFSGVVTIFPGVAYAGPLPNGWVHTWRAPRLCPRCGNVLTDRCQCVGECVCCYCKENLS